MQYTDNYRFKKPDQDDAYDIQNENDNMDLIDETLKNTVDNVGIELNAALQELRNAIANAQAILESLVDNKIADHTASTNNPHKVTLAQVLGGGGSSVIPVANGGTGNSSVDTTPTQNSTKMVTSGGVYTAIQNASPKSHTHGAGDITSGTLPVARGGTGNTAVDTTPTSGSTKMVTSGGVYTALAGKAASSHNHSASNITSGTLPLSRGGLGRTTKTTTSTDYEFRAIKVQTTIPTAIDSGCIVLVV